MSTVFDYKSAAKNNPGVNAEIIAASMNFQEFLVKSGVGRKASYRIDRPSEQHNENSRHPREQKIVTRVF